MDVQSIFEAGGTVIKNPNYSKSKKNTQPEYITVSDLDSSVSPTGSLVADIAYDAAASGRQEILGREDELDRYIKQGLTPNDFENLDVKLANAQSFSTKFGNMLAQTLVSELALGIPKAFSDLLDVVGQAVGLSSPDYTNPVSQFLEQKQEEFRNYAPIHVDPTLNISNGGLLDSGWWLSNMPSVVSSLTLLLPAGGIVKGASMLSKAAGVGQAARRSAAVLSKASKKVKLAQELRKAGKSAEEIRKATELSKFQRFITSPSTAKQTGLFLENASTAAISRTVENYQEARQTYNDMYVKAAEHFTAISDEDYAKIVAENEQILKQAGVDPTNKDEVAKAIAKQAADRTFQMDWMNVGFDIIQMYGLRNAWKGIKNAPTGSAKVRRRNLDQAKYFGKSEAEIKELKKKRGFLEKAGEFIEDRAYASKLVIGAQLSEGAEEAINYIASEEGMHFGDVLLGKAKGKKDTGFWNAWSDVYDTRLMNYLNAPELYDSAFWGVMGGIIFQGLGSKFNKIKNKIGSSSDTNESAAEQLPWYKLDELPEIKRRLGDIDARQTDYIEFKEQLDRINDGIDVVNSTPENEVHFSSDAEQEVARKQLLDEFISKMTLRAMRSGNLDMLKAYLNNYNVRKGLIQAGMYGKHEANMSAEQIEAEMKQYADDVLKKVEEVEKAYEQELVVINDIAAQLNAGRSRKNLINDDYIQIIANNNIHAIAKLGHVEREQRAVEQEIAELEQLYGDKLDTNINYKAGVRLNVFIDELRRLRAKRKRIMKDNGDTLSAQVAITNIDKQIEDIENKLNDAELQYATFQSLAYSLDDKGNLVRDEQSEAEAYAYRDKMIIQATEENEGREIDLGDLEKLGLGYRHKTQLDAANIGKVKTMESDVATVSNTIKGISEKLNGYYKTAAALELSNDFFRSQIARTTKEVDHEVGVLHNTMNEAREKVLNEAYDKLAELYKKYGEGVEDIIIAEVNPTRDDLAGFAQEARSQMSAKDQATLDFYLDALKLKKAYNRSLAYEISDRFRKEDKLKSKSVDEENQENSTSENPLSADESVEGNSSSVEAGSNITEQQNAENEPIDPQDITNRQPSFYGKFYDDKGKLVSKRKVASDNGGAVIYDNFDGTYTIDVRNNAAMKNDSRMFANARSIDLTRNTEVARLPIARRNSKGHLYISEPGELRYTDGVEAQQEQAQEQQIAQQQVAPATANAPTSSEQLSTNNGQVEQPAANNPSTGGSITPSQPQATAPTPATAPATAPAAVPTEQPAPKVEIIDVIFDQAPIEDDVRNTALREFLNAYRQDKNVDLDKLAQELIKDQTRKGVPESVAINAVNHALDSVKRTIERRRNAKEKTFNSTVDEVLISQSSMLVSNKLKEAVAAYQEAVREMIGYYTKEFGLKPINGKYYINLENLLRYVNKTTNDKNMASALYDSLKEYIENEGKDLYAVTDNTSLTRDEALSNISKSRLARLKEAQQDDVDYRVNIKAIFDSVESDEELAELEKEFNALKLGDKLGVKVEKGKIVLSSPNGKPIGTMTVPGIDAVTGGFSITHTGWKYDLTSVNGKVQGTIKTLLEQWISPTTEAAKEINDIIKELAYGNPSENRKNDLYLKLENNPEFQRAQRLSLTTKKSNVAQLANGLIGIWKYTEVDETASKEYQDLQRQDSINRWFDKLYNEYGVYYQISRGAEVDMTISTISEGELIATTPEEALPASKAIAGGVNPDVHKVMIGNPRVKYDTIVSGKGHTSGFNFAQGRTAVIIPTAGAKTIWANAYLSGITDGHLGKEAKEIVQAIHEQIDTLIDAYATEPNEETYNALFTFIDSIIGYNRGVSTLFAGLRFDVATVNGRQQFAIQLSKDEKIVFYSRRYIKDTLPEDSPFSTRVRIQSPEFAAENENSARTLNINSEEARKRIHEMLNNLSFRVDAAYLDGDNVANKPLNGIGSRSNGKFTIKVGDKTWEFNSYNEFLLKNDILKLTTKPNEQGNSNFIPRADKTQRNNMQLKVKITDKTPSPVKEEKPTQPAKPTSNEKPIEDRIISILNSNEENKGEAIVREAIGTIPEITESTLNSFKKLHLFPKSIKFVEQIISQADDTDLAYASANKATGEVTVSRRWLDLFSDPSTRGRAIRILFHEQLHVQLNKNQGYIRSARRIYNEFKQALNNGNIKGNRSAEELEHLRAYLFEDERTHTIALEEFLVESLTNEELARALNDIDADVTKKKGGRNLFQKILDLISKVFNWGVREGSLYEKELQTLNKLGKTINTQVVQTKTKTSTKKNSEPVNNQPTLFDNNPDVLEESDTKTKELQKDKQAETTPKTPQEIVDKIVKDSKKSNLTEDEVYYINEETNTLGVRVTTAIQADDENLDENGNPHTFNNPAFITPSTNIGTGIDEFTRDFFLGKLDNLSEEELEQRYPNVTGSDWVSFREQLSEFRNKLSNGEIIKDKNITIVSRDVKAVGQVDVVMPDGSTKKLNVSGTLDLLGYDQDGKFYVFDMKTVHSDSYISDFEKQGKWNRQLQLYKQFLEDKYGIEIAGTRIIPIKVDYDMPLGGTDRNGRDLGGTAVYEVRNPELKTVYDNPMRTQLLQDGEEFRDAAPKLRSTLEMRPHKGRIQYNSLDQSAKDILDGKYTVESYKEKLEKDKANVPIDIKEEIKPEEGNQDEFSKVEDDGSFDKFDSVVEEQVSTQSDYTPEMQSIKEQAIADGTFMKAPNGSPTNLNEKQWLQVRTTNFKNWFGDWIDNPSKASKVVDENGEPLVVYHGSPISDFNIFEKSDVNSGYYFTSDKEYANSYGNTRNFFLNIKNIKDISFTYKKNNKTLWNGKSFEVSEPYYNGRFISPYEEAELELNHKNVDRDSEYYKSKGFDGIKGNDSFNEELNTGSNGIEYVVFNPNQIKSATSNTGEFSTTNDDIRYSVVEELPSIPAFTERLPIDQQAEFMAQIDSAEISTRCR